MILVDRFITLQRPGGRSGLGFGTLFGKLHMNHKREKLWRAIRFSEGSGKLYIQLWSQLMFQLRDQLLEEEDVPEKF